MNSTWCHVGQTQISRVSWIPEELGGYPRNPQRELHVVFKECIKSFPIFEFFSSVSPSHVDCGHIIVLEFAEISEGVISAANLKSQICIVVRRRGQRPRAHLAEDKR